MSRPKEIKKAIEDAAAGNPVDVTQMKEALGMLRELEKKGLVKRGYKLGSPFRRGPRAASDDTVSPATRRRRLP